MKVLYVDQTGQLGGGELALLPWLRATASGEMAVVLFEDGPFRIALEQAGVSVKVLTQSGLRGVRRESGVKQVLQSIPTLLSLRSSLAKIASNFDVLYANSQKAFLLSAMCKRRNQCLVWHLRDILTAEHFSWPLRKIAVFMGNRFASLVVANSQATADSFVASGGHPKKVRVVHDGVGASEFDAVDPQVVDALRRELLSGGEEQLIGVFGRLSPWKGQHVFLDAISATSGVKGVLVGDALFGEDAFAEELRARAAEPDLAGRVVFLGFRRDVPALMKAMDIIAHTSTSAEPFGLVIVEGMLAGKPVIATRAGGAMEILQDGDTGLLVAPGSAHELHTAFERLLADKALAARIARSGRSHAERVFCLEVLFESIRAVLAECKGSR